MQTTVQVLQFNGISLCRVSTVYQWAIQLNATM